MWQWLINVGESNIWKRKMQAMKNKQSSMNITEKCYSSAYFFPPDDSKLLTWKK